jgi:hypothetical protein
MLPQAVTARGGNIGEVYGSLGPHRSCLHADQ